MEILEKFNIIPKNISLYKQAFTHTSYANEHNVKDEHYERLEFLGDAVLELVISEYLYKNTEFEEGKMTKLRASYVCENALYNYAMEINLQNYLKLGKGEKVTAGKYKKAILADIFESFIGAIYLDLGIDKVREFIYETVIPHIESRQTYFKDYKSYLQELVQPMQKSLEYEIISETGPAHKKLFDAEVKVGGIVLGFGRATTKKDAEQEAAKDALSKYKN